MKVGIAGTGAVGGYIGGTLALAGHEVVFLSRGTNLRTMQEKGLTISNSENEFVVHKEFTNSLDRFRNVELVIISVKSNDTSHMAEKLSYTISTGTPILLLQNGVDNEEKVMKYFGINRIFSAAVYLTSRITAPGRIEVFGNPRLTIGSIDPAKMNEAKELTNLFREASIQSHTSSNIMRAKWKKLLWNVTFNPLSAYAGVTVGQILDQIDLRHLAEVALREGMNISDLKGYFFQEELIDQIFKSAQIAETHYTSMLQDRLSGKNLEIESICGYFVKEADKKSISIPVIQSLYTSLSSLEKTNRRS
ncbi:ketopantoate reductase family protein [Pseudalkalibacillus hwajinpoensis]|uniref:ketopantoate reductase family protein n=1 Tax=Guptibacillus hwajinpoensis TaxID=208199 RepID=UPI00325B834E